jgi:hypothetical protein
MATGFESAGVAYLRWAAKVPLPLFKSTEILSLWLEVAMSMSPSPSKSSRPTMSVGASAVAYLTGAAKVPSARLFSTETLAIAL